MAIKKAVLALLILATSVLFLNFWQAGNANGVGNTTAAMSSQEVKPKKFNAKEVVSQLPLKEKSTTSEVKLVSHPSTSPELEGKLNSEYQIREDILAYIDEATKNNEKARRAAIKFAYYENQSYYHSLNADEAVAWDRKSSLAGWCLVVAEPDNWLSISNKVEAFINDTAKRKQHIKEIDHKFFAWKALGTGLTQDEENERCKSGNF